jgi:hypothetical protein
MKKKDFEKLLERDKYCLHCGETERLAPNHRANRGMGGSKERDVPSNIVLLCSEFNGLIESDAHAADRARMFGWKLSTWEDPKSALVFDFMAGESFLLDDGWGRSLVLPKEN